MFKRRTLAHLMAAAALAPVSAGAQGRLPLSRIAFGSCRKSAPHDEENTKAYGVDAMRAYALHLMADDEEWPDLFVFLGDQVYADETSDEMREFIAARRDIDWAAQFLRALHLLDRLRCQRLGMVPAEAPEHGHGIGDFAPHQLPGKVDTEGRGMCQLVLLHA